MITVKYTALPPTAGATTRAIGRFTYSKAKTPPLMDRIKAAAGMDQ